MATNVIDHYDETANAGRRDAWCDLFTDDQVMDEQLAGHIESLATLRPMMAGWEGTRRFQNVPKHIVVPGRRSRRRLAHLRGQRRRRADRGEGARTTSSSATGRSPTWRTSTTRARSARSSTRSWAERRWPTYDFIVVGAGSAGSCRGELASPRISDVNVLALEAGGAESRERPRTPAIWYTLFGTDVDWGTSSAPQNGARRPPDLRAPRASAGRLERPLHHDAHPGPRLGLRRLGRQRLRRAGRYEECLPWFQKLEDQEDDTNPRPEGRAAAGHERRQARPEPDLAGVHRCVRRSSATRRPTTSTARTWKAPAGTTSTCVDGKRFVATAALPRAGSCRAEPDLRDRALAGDEADHRGRPMRRRRVRQGRREPPCPRVAARSSSAAARSNCQAPAAGLGHRRPDGAPGGTGRAVVRPAGRRARTSTTTS